MTDDTLANALHTALPTNLHSSIPVLVQVLLVAYNGQSTSVATDTLQEALHKLQGETLISQQGDIKVGNTQGEGIAIGHGAQATSIRIYMPQSEEQKRAWRNRSRMLEKVEKYWIRGYLHDSLQGMPFILPPMSYAADAVVNSWETMVQSPDRVRGIVSLNQSITDVFDKSGGELLILGAPGTGKTIIMLELARVLIERAQHNEQLPIPVIFNLSSWAQKQQPLTAWLIVELRERYDIPIKIAKDWIEQQHILPLLDGLDEVQEGCRAPCVQAINTFRKEHGIVGTIVCSRYAEYGALNEKLHLQDAVVLHPFHSSQIDAHLQRMSIDMRHVQMVLHHLQETARIYQDEEALSLMHTPLMVSIIALAYQGADSSDTALAQMTPTAQQDHVFATYVQRMFERRATTQAYQQAQSRHWLAWLAHTLQQYDQTSFFIELMQPVWLAPARWLTFDRWTGFIRGVWLGIAVASFLIFILVFLLVVIGWLSWLTQQPLALVLLALLIIVILSAMIFGMIGVYAAQKEPTPEAIYLVEKFEIPEGAVHNAIIRGLTLGIPVALILALGWAWLGVLAGIATGGAVVALLVGRSMSAAQQSVIRLTPNQGVWQSARNALLVSLIGGGQVGIALGILAGMTMNTALGLVLGICAGLGTSMFAALFFGFETFFKHFLLRTMLIREGSIPRSYVPFLEYATERIFLRKVGGGYIFVHRLLMDHFASLYTNKA